MTVVVEIKTLAMENRTGPENRRVRRGGSAPGRTGDLILGGRTFRVNACARGVRHLYGPLEGRFGLIVAVDGRQPLLVVRLRDFLRLRRPGGPSESPRPKTTPQLSGGPR